MTSFYEEFRMYYLPWVIAAAAIAIVLWQQHTTMQLVERINAGYLDRLSTVSRSLDQLNTTLKTEGYTVAPLASTRGTDARASR